MRFSITDVPAIRILPHGVAVVSLFLIVANCWLPLNAQTEPEEARELQPFEEVVAPILNRYCIDCHGELDPDAKLDLSRFRSTEHLNDYPDLWQEVATRIAEREMPPEDGQPLEAAEREQVISWLAAWRREMAARDAGDPGVVLTRRLNASEYNYTLRDLLGVDIRPAKEFPVDPANEAGFDNSGQSLAMSPGLLNKYLSAARSVSEHAVLTPQGIDFAPHPVMTETDRDKYAVNRIVDFYRRQPTELADYLFAAWRLQHNPSDQHHLPGQQVQPDPHDVAVAGEARPNEMITEEAIHRCATDLQLSQKYLQRIVGLLQQPSGSDCGSELPEDSASISAGSTSVPVLDWLRCQWQREVLSQANPQLAKEASIRLAKEIQGIRDVLQPKIDNLKGARIHSGSQPFVLWKNRQYALNRQRYVPEHFDALNRDAMSPEVARVLAVPDAERRAEFDAQLSQFCETFPDAFYISERGRDYLGTPREKQEKGRLLSAGFHSMMGYFRDDGPLMDLILSESERVELDTLWQELDFITDAPIRQYLGFLWFERTDSEYMRDEEFDFARAEDKLAATGQMIRKLAEVYIGKAERGGATGNARQALVEYFEQIEQQIAWVESAGRAAKPKHLDALVAFGQRAFRGLWGARDERELRAFYQQLVDVEGLSHQEAIQDSIVMLLMSPKFVYRVDLNAEEATPTRLTSTELASRLSYLLWSSMPDEELLEVAATGQLNDSDTLLAQTNRLLADPRSRALAVEFGGQWLGFRRFEEHNSVDRDRFPEFTDSLRQAMYEEPVQFLSDMIRNNRSVLECIKTDRVFVTEELADHYGIELPTASSGDGSAEQASAWQVVESPQIIGRGGLPTMAVFLTQNSPGLRTSPVKRGYWVVRQLLGERIPPPPPGVPELPQDESQLGELSLREVLERHREQASCAVCHDRFDALGLVFENYGPVGELRSVDLAGKPVDTSVVFPDGTIGQGVEDLQKYMLDVRREDFLDNLCKKLLAYSLGRTLQISDDSLLQAMRENLERDQFQFSSLIRTIVSSPQFQQKRGERRTNSTVAVQ